MQKEKGALMKYLIFFLVLFYSFSFSEVSLGWDNGLSVRKNLGKNTIGISINTRLGFEYHKFEDTTHFSNGWYGECGDYVDINFIYFRSSKINDFLSIGPYIRIGNRISFCNEVDYSSTVFLFPEFHQIYSINKHLYIETKVGLIFYFDPENAWSTRDEYGDWVNTNSKSYNFEFDDNVISNLGLFYTF